MRISDKRITGIYTYLIPLEKAGFSYEVIRTSETSSIWAYIYIKRKWFWGFFSYNEKIGDFWPKPAMGITETYLNVESCHDEVLEMLKGVSEFKDVLIKLNGRQYLGGTKPE